MRVLLTSTVAASVLGLGLSMTPAESRPIGPDRAAPSTALQKVQAMQEFDRERAKARVRQRAGERLQEMGPMERLRAKRRLNQARQRLEDRKGYGYISRERAKARARNRMEQSW
jgi:hypothetical protein